MPWGPRTLDIDILAYKDRVMGWPAGRRRSARGSSSSRRLAVPHRQLHLRPFVLAPLAEIAPDWRHPLTRRTVTEMLAALPAAELSEIVPLE